MSRSIYDDGRHYDRLYPRGDCSFWIKLARESSGPVLELACGTGQIALAIAEEGSHVVGLDRSPGMLAQARRKAASLPYRVEFVDGDMRDFRLSLRFALVILAGNSLGHLLDVASFERWLACVRQHLLPAGRLAVDMFVPDVNLLAQQPGTRYPFGEYEAPDSSGTVTITFSAVYEPNTQIRRFKTYTCLPDRPDEAEGTLDLRMYFPQELDALFRYNGFQIEEKYGDLYRSPFTTTSRKQVFVLSTTGN
jgi:SAM-dependent methyltransferase